MSSPVDGRSGLDRGSDLGQTHKAKADEGHGGKRTLDENYVIKLNQLNNENVLMAETTRNDITVNGTVRSWHPRPRQVKPWSRSASLNIMEGGALRSVQR